MLAIRTICLSLAIGSLFSAVAIAQEQQSMSSEFKLTPEARKALSQLHDAKTEKKQIVFFDSQPRGGRLTFAVAPAFPSTPSCPTVPQPSEATSFFDHALYMTQDVAASLKITWIASGSANVDKNSQVFVRDFARFARCKATDGSGNVLYGSRLRATVLVDQTDVSGGANFAVAAASATVKNRSVQVEVDGGAFTDQAIATNASDAQNLTASGLNVDHYSDFNNKMGAAYSAAVRSGVAMMEPIGFEPDLDTTDFVKGLSTTFAIDRMAQGFGCDDTVKQFNRIFPDKAGQFTESAIRTTYQVIAKGCDASGPIVRATAEAIIGGQRFAN
jgi:hypothetical protein